VAELQGRNTAWLRAPERAETMGEARVLGESAEAARILGQELRSGRVVASDGTRFTRVAVLAGAGAPALRWMAEGLPITHLDPRRVAESRERLAALRAEWRETLVLAVGEGLEVLRVEVDAALRTVGLEDRGRWVLCSAPGSATWAGASRWRARLAVPDWVLPEALPTAAAGILLAEWAGTDTVRMGAGAREVDDWCAEPVAATNPAAWLAHGLSRPVSLFVDRSALGGAAAWASAAAAARGRVLVVGEPVASWERWALLGPEGDAPTDTAVEIRVDPADPASAGAWCALVERALDLADRGPPPPW